MPQKRYGNKGYLVRSMLTPLRSSYLFVLVTFYVVFVMTLS